MKELEDRYISLLTDFGFKRIFGTVMNKDLLINFLNSLFEGKEVVRDVTYLNSENVGDVYAERKAIFDVYCENERGEKFIVEMQNAHQKFFKDRSLFYLTFPIREQAPKGSDWDFELKAVYAIALLNYDMSEPSFDAADQRHEVMLCDTKTKRVFSTKLTLVYVEVSKFDKEEGELVTMFDKWQYLLKNLSRLASRPRLLQERIFTRLFEQAEIAKFSPRELREYENSRKAYRDIKNSLDTAIEEGRELGRQQGLAEGRAEGLAKGLAKGRDEGLAKGRDERSAEIARNLLALGTPMGIIVKSTGLTEEEIESLR